MSGDAVSIAPDEPMFMEAVEHSVENIGENEGRAFIIELK